MRIREARRNFYLASALIPLAGEANMAMTRGERREKGRQNVAHFLSSGISSEMEQGRVMRQRSLTMTRVEFTDRLNGETSSAKLRFPLVRASVRPSAFVPRDRFFADEAKTGRMLPSFTSLLPFSHPRSGLPRRRISLRKHVLANIRRARAIEFCDIP